MQKKYWIPLAVSLIAGATTMLADEGKGYDQDVPKLDHVFVIVMENHGFSQIWNNPNAPFANQLARSANLATNYFAVAHPSLTNYLEIVGGSNFGVLSDDNPDWHNRSCVPNIVLHSVNDESTSPAVICPIWGEGLDAKTTQFDTTNETTPPSILKVTNIDGVYPEIASAPTKGKTIADQLAERGMSWKSYQESLSASGADGVNYSDGFFTDASNIPGVIPGESQGLVKLYAVKHNPFAYFRSVQEGEQPHSSLANVVGFQGPRGLFDDLGSGRVPAFSFIAPNQCNDQHGRGNAGPQCDFDPKTDGSQSGLNPALIAIGDSALRTIVMAIHNSPAWRDGRNAIVVVWDENDYSGTPNTNRVMTIVDTNYGKRGVTSSRFYTHFSLLKTIEAGLGLPCLNHACDASVAVMSDLFDDRH